MPTVNKVGSKKPATAKQPTNQRTAGPERIDPNDTPPSYGSTTTLAPNPSDAKALAKATSNLSIPDFMENNVLPEVGDSGTGYVGFASSNSLNWPQMQMAGLKEGQPFCHHNGQYIAVETLEFFLLLADSFQTLMVGKQGEFKFATRDMSLEGPRQGTNRTEPHYVCLLLVKVENELLPIKGDFRGTKSGGVEGAIRSVEAAAEPEWLKMSDAHRITSAFPKPFGRVFHRVTTSYQVSKTSGNPYYRAKCASQPATIAQMQLLADKLKDDDFRVNLKEAKGNYDQRIQFLDNIATNGPAVPQQQPAR